MRHETYLLFHLVRASLHWRSCERMCDTGSLYLFEALPNAAISEPPEGCARLKYVALTVFEITECRHMQPLRGHQRQPLVARRAPEGRQEDARRLPGGQQIKAIKVCEKAAGKPPQGFEEATDRWFEDYFIDKS